MEHTTFLKTEKKRSVPIRIAFWTVIALASLLSAVQVWFGITYFGMRPVIVAQYGEPLPDAKAFSPRYGAVYEDVAEEVETLGLHKVTVRVRGRDKTVWLWVRDTVAPQATGLERTISTLETLRPDQLIEHLSDRDDRVRVSFLETPPFGTVGDYPVAILLEDTSGNAARADATLHIRVTNEGVTLEAGSEIPAARAFLRDDYAVSAMTEITEKMLHTPGEYPIALTVDGTVYDSLLTVVDTVAPEAETAMVVRVPGETVAPEDFLTSVVDESEVTAEFVTAPDWDSRAVQTVTIQLTDLGGNASKVREQLLFTHAKPVSLEARTEPLRADECLTPGAYESAELKTPFVPNRVGSFAVMLVVDGTEELALVAVRDTVKPKIKAEDTAWYTGHPLDPAELCTVTDITETTVEAREPIDWTKEGEQQVTLLATDAGGNTAKTSLTLTLSKDTEGPELYGVRDRNCYVGEPVAYFAEVFAEDTLDGVVEVNVDKSKVNANAAGAYAVVYTAVDSDGNETSASCQFRFINATVTDEEVEALAAAVLADITTPDMTTTEKLEAVYNYVRGHVHYVNSSDKNDWRKEAVRGFQKGTGDCFTFYSTTRALLDQIGVDYMSVTRKGGRTRHYWVIVNVGTGWYHFDPTFASRHKHRCFMWTNQQCKIKPYFWRFEESIYPEIATEPFDKDAVIAMEREGTLPNNR